MMKLSVALDLVFLAEWLSCISAFFSRESFLVVVPIES